MSIQTAQFVQRNVLEDRPRERIRTGRPRIPFDSALRSNRESSVVPVHTMQHGPIPQDRLRGLTGSVAMDPLFGQDHGTRGRGCLDLRSEPDLHVRQEFRDRSQLGYISSGMACVLPITPTFSWDWDPCLLRAEVLLF
jgi:hypothetical protein